jgi:hypothetical protein
LGFVEEVGISCQHGLGYVLHIQAGSSGRVLIKPARRELGAIKVNLVEKGTSEGKCTLMGGVLVF